MPMDIARMANEIARFHDSYPPDEGGAMWAEHINKFWPPSMRSRFHQMVESDPKAFHGLVLANAGRVRCAERNPISLEGMDRTGTGG